MIRRTDSTSWDVPGGRINHHEDPQQALLRELREELPGITNISIGPLLYADKTDFLLSNGHCLMLLCYRVDAKLPAPIKLSQEHSTARWIELSLPRTIKTSKPIASAVIIALCSSLSQANFDTSVVL
jgi:8-oxo-dGTP pyrophosphatase MutT (NUDIX family)